MSSNCRNDRENLLHTQRPTDCAKIAEIIEVNSLLEC